MQLEELLTGSILYFFIPLWVLAGFSDWLFHRATRISETSGVRESLLHMLMLAEAGLPMLAGLFLEINALIIAFMIAGFLAHEATVLADLRYAIDKRAILPGEQIVHSFQEVIPLILLALVAFLHWDQFVALVTLDSNASFALEWKHDPLPPAYLASLLAGTGLLVILPFIEELVRCYRHASKRQHALA